ncbi:MAG: 3-keto-5-aminohexanoate cleavage protein [Hyphomonas sp.]|nr:3-keto-5-aminohexanoate cleavage protein [Hyphomonas sp.]
MRGRLITVAPNGARKMPGDHPRLPISPESIASEAKLAADAGAALLHLHVRTADGAHSLDPALYREAIAAVHATCGDRLMVQITTESAGVFGWQEQVRAITETKPEAASMALREMCPTDSASDRAAYADFIADCLAEGVWLQHILYSPEEVARFNRLHETGIFGTAPFVLLVVGRYGGGETSTRAALDAMSSALASGIVWAACAFGVAETDILDHALATGGHVRVGFENNLLHTDGSIADSNAARVERIASLVTARGLTVMERNAIADAFALPQR